MTDQRNPGRTPEPSDEHQPYRPPQRREPQRDESQRGESQRREPERREPEHWLEEDSEETFSDQRFSGQSAEEPRTPPRSPLGPRPIPPQPAQDPAAQPQRRPYRDEQAADPYPQRRSQPRRPTADLSAPYASTAPVAPPPAVPPTGPANRQANQPAKVPSRLPFWLGFVLSFLFLSVASLGILLLSTGADRFDLASLQGNEAAWTPPEIVPTPTQDPAFAGAVNASSSGSGQYGTGTTLRNVTNTNVRIRQSPGHLGKPAGDIIAGIPADGQVDVIGGPATVDGLTWWQVRSTNSSGQVVEGWSAEVSPSGLRILGPDQ